LGTTTVKRMNKNILLVEPGYRTYYPPLGLMKISRWHKEQKDIVNFIKVGVTPGEYFGGSNKRLKKHYDEIYITSLFTYHAAETVKAIQFFQNEYPQAQIKVGGVLATLLPNIIKEQTGIMPTVGLLDGPGGAEESAPDYSLFPNLKCSITFTSRGCKRRCEFCAVSKHEPEYTVKENWEKDVHPKKNVIIFWDNNWLQSPNFFKDVEKLKKLDRRFDFNQGLDCRLFDEEKAKALADTKIKPLRFAFDNCAEDGHIQKAIKLARKTGFNDIRVYVLFNSEYEEDTPEYFYDRINEMNRRGVLTYPMRYRPINSTNGNYISPRWDKKLLRAVKLITLFYYSGGLIRKNREAFKEIFGRDRRAFKNKMYKVFEYDKRLKR